MYRLTASNAVVRIEDGAWIPADPDNADHRAYLEWLAAGNTPEPVPVVDWRPAAAADLNIKREQFLRILTSMQIDYSMKGQDANATACMDAKEQVKVIETAAGVQAVYQNQPGSRDAFDLAVKARWAEIVAPAPTQVKSDFSKYGGNTV